ncbi:MAG TPA: TonB-dependent receptor [Telluria sp.]|nr:TonB-dependent receptor [Telluria sp.]
MQSVFNQQPKLRLSLIALACQLACASAAFAQTASSDAAAPKAEVVITGKKIGMGLMVNEDAPKARSTITAEELEKQRPTGNAYQALEMLPAVNSYNYDATGLFGGGMTLRGFNSDQIGATINGVPVNDSGSFSVFPQEYVDQENTCSEFVTQGSTDVDSPQVGATGGNFGITTCDPEKVQRVRIMQTFGQLNMYKTFVRYDTGLLDDKRSKFFISASHAQADKWKGLGGGKRDHVDAGANYDWDRFNFIHATVLYNEALNNNINSISLADIAKNGYYYDFSNTFTPGHLTPGKGTVQKETGPTPQYYQLATNPFKNAIASATAKFRLNENLDLKILPYYWWGYGTGGVQQRALSETGFLNVATGKLGAATDLNGDGDTLDTVIVSNSSVTRTNRPGITSSLTYQVGDHSILGGFWYERAQHRQTGPAVAVNPDGSPVDYWLKNGQILRPDGSPFESRDWLTISTAYQAFLQDTMVLMNDRLTLNVGVRTPFVDRDFTNNANEGTNSGTTYRIEKKYHDVLPQLGARYRITNDDQLFASLAKNMKAPPNFVFATTGSNVAIVNGVAQLIEDVKPEISYNLDVGYRHQDDKWIGSLTAYSIDFRDRQATAFNPITAVSTLTNVGKVRNQGFEIELGNTPINGWSFYGSYGYSKSEIRSDIVVSATATLKTTGNAFVLTPKNKASVSAEYQVGSFWARAKAKATSSQWATLANDEEVPGYTTFDIDGGYTLPNFGVIKRPKLNFNISNITNKQYRNPSSQSVRNAVALPGISASTVFYYLGAPRFVSATLSMDF